MGHFSYILIFFGTIITLSSCSEKKEVYTLNFPETVSLTVPEIRVVEEVSLRYPFRIRKDSSGVYLMDLHGVDYYCHHLEYPSMQLIRSFAKQGKGPDELLGAENIRLTRKSGCWVLDANNAGIYCFEFGESDYSTTVRLDKRLVRSLDFDLYNDSLFVVPDYTGTHRFDILSSDGRIKEKRGEIPLKKRDHKISDMAYAQAWRSFLSCNPDNGILAIATQLGDVIQIYNIPGDSLVNTIQGKEGIPRFVYKNGHAIPDGIMGYSDIYVGKEYVYALFWGHTFDDIKRNIVDVEGGNIIRVFDLDGNPVKQYMLDHYLTGFFIDEENKMLIGLNVNSDEQIVEYTFKD